MIIIQHQHSFGMVLGDRVQPTTKALKLRARTYLKTLQLPEPPTQTNFWTKADGWLSNILGNDTLPNCTGAAAGHLMGAALLNANNEMPLTADDVIAFYWAAGGTNDGADEISILNYWRDTGIKATSTGQIFKITGWLSVDANSPRLIKQCLALFQIVTAGLCLPQEWVDMMPTLKNGDVFDVAGPPNPNYGHEIALIDIHGDDKGMWIDTWGFKVLLTWAAIAKYCKTENYGELYTAVTPGSIVQGTIHNPLGVTWSDMLADFAATSYRS